MPLGAWRLALGWDPWFAILSSQALGVVLETVNATVYGVTVMRTSDSI